MGNIFCPQNKYLSDAYYYDKSSWFVISENNIDSNTGRYPFCIYITGMNISCGLEQLPKTIIIYNMI